MNRIVLILSANPLSTARLRLDEEVREISEGLYRSHHWEEFSLLQKWAVRPTDLYRALLENRPQIVHFSGHGAGNDGIVLEDTAGHIQLVTEEALYELFALFPQIECVLLNACYTERQAKAIAKSVSFVIGINSDIDDSAAISFAVAFYDALGAGESYEFAYRIGCSSMRLHGVAPDRLPVLVSDPKNVETYNLHKKTYQDSLTAQQQREHFKALGDTVHAYAGQVINEFLTRLVKSQNDATNTVPISIEGIWQGMVNGLEQVVKIRQKGTVVYLEGNAGNESEETGYVFIGEGRIIYGVLVFSWQIRDAKGVNVMSVLDDANVLDGKYFTAMGGAGSEIYYRSSPIADL